MVFNRFVQDDDIVILLDGDDFLYPSALEQLSKCFKKQKKIDMLVLKSTDKLKYLEENNLTNKTDIIVPDSAHGTNPASAKMAGFNVVEVSTDVRGMVNIDDLKELVNENTAGLMLTNPNTGGLFEENIMEISNIILENGGLD